MPTYSVEVRESLHDGDDYSENHYDFDSKDEIRKFLENDLSEGEHLHSVLEYADGQTSNPRDITNQFYKRKKRY